MCSSVTQLVQFTYNTPDLVCLHEYDRQVNFTNFVAIKRVCNNGIAGGHLYHLYTHYLFS